MQKEKNQAYLAKIRIKKKNFAINLINLKLKLK